MVSGIRARSTTEDDFEIRRDLQMTRERYARQQKVDYSHVFRKKSIWGIFRLCFIMMGIEFAYAAETAFVSPILLQIGISHQHMTMVWGLSPIFGFFFAPLLGSMTDQCRLQMGRRRPFILVLSITIILGLIWIPYGKDIGKLFGDVHGINFSDEILPDESSSIRNYKWAIVFTVLGTVLLDFSADSIQTPSRAYLLDSLVPEDHARGLSTYSVMAGIGGFFGYGLGSVNWDSGVIGDFFGGNVKTVFGIVLIIFVLSMITTVTSFRELPLSVMENDIMLRPITQLDVKMERERISRPVFVIVEKDENMNGLLDIQDIGIQHVSFTQYLKSVIFMPRSSMILCITNVFTSMAQLSYCLYFTDFVGDTVFHGNAVAAVGSIDRDLYDAGIRWGCWGLAISALSCSVYSFLIEHLIKAFRIKVVYIGGLFFFAVGMLFLAMYPNKIVVLVLSISAGILHGTYFTIPYILVAHYHAKNCFKRRKGLNVDCKNERGLGTDIAIVSSMLFVAQIIVSLSVGPVVEYFNSTNVVIYAASIFSCLASVSAGFVLYLDL